MITLVWSYLSIPFCMALAHFSTSKPQETQKLRQRKAVFPVLNVILLSVCCLLFVVFIKVKVLKRDGLKSHTLHWDSDGDAVTHRVYVEGQWAHQLSTAVIVSMLAVMSSIDVYALLLSFHIACLSVGRIDSMKETLEWNSMWKRAVAHVKKLSNQPPLLKLEQSGHSVSASGWRYISQSFRLPSVLEVFSVFATCSAW